MLLATTVALVLWFLFAVVWPQSPATVGVFGGVFIGFLGALIVETFDD